MPVGSIIVLADGWQYRPDAWPATPSRPGVVTESYVEVTDEWWGNYTKRGINLSKINNPSLEGITLADIQDVLVIYVPKN